MKELLISIENEIKKINPEYCKELCIPATDTDILLFEKKYAIELPTIFKELFRWHNGQKGYIAIISNYTLMSIKQIDESLKIWNNLLDSGTIKDNFWKKSWIPFLENGAGDYICLDIEGTGIFYQIIQFWHDSPKREILYPNLISFFENLEKTYRTEGKELKELIEIGEESDFYLDMCYPKGFPKKIEYIKKE